MRLPIERLLSSIRNMVTKRWPLSTVREQLCTRQFMIPTKRMKKPARTYRMKWTKESLVRDHMPSVGDCPGTMVQYTF
jgi:hypothetical protein